MSNGLKNKEQIMEPKYEYLATLIRVVDGDTIWADVDYGFREHGEKDLRFLGINCPEKGKPGYVEATDFTKFWIPTARRGFLIKTKEDREDPFGRWLAWIILPDGRCLNQMLVDQGLAVPMGPYPISPPAKS